MLPIQRKISAYNFYTGNNIQYIVIHDVGTVSSAKNNADYFSGGNRNASAHYFVDDISIWQSVEDKNGAWHVGDGYGKYGITNTNSIGIEMCLKAPLTVTDKTVTNTLELTRHLMGKYNIPASRVVRHYDASRKACPGSFKANNWSKWIEFKNRLTGGEGTVSNDYKLIPSEPYMNHVPNMVGEQKDGKYIKAVIKKVPTEKMASGMVGFIRERTRDLLTNGNVFGLDYPNKRMLKFVGLTRKQANDWKAEVTRLAQGQYVNYSASNVKVVNAADGKSAWIEVDNISKDNAAFNRLRNNLRAKYAQELLATRISYKKESDGTYTVSVINIETMDRATEIVRRLRRWYPGATNAYDDAVAVLQY